MPEMHSAVPPAQAMQRPQMAACASLAFSSMQRFMTRRAASSSGTPARRATADCRRAAPATAAPLPTLGRSAGSPCAGAGSVTDTRWRLLPPFNRCMC